MSILRSETVRVPLRLARRYNLYCHRIVLRRQVLVVTKSVTITLVFLNQ